MPDRRGHDDRVVERREHSVVVVLGVNVANFGVNALRIGRKKVRRDVQFRVKSPPLPD